MCYRQDSLPAHANPSLFGGCIEEALTNVRVRLWCTGRIQETNSMPGVCSQFPEKKVVKISK